jgi:short-subunit dehydrogenase
MANPRKTALVTGASSGIGLELARQLARDGDDLVLVARDAARLSAVARDLAADTGVDVRWKSVDLSNPDAVHRLWDELTAEHVSIDILVNNAGIGVYGNFDEQEVRAVETVTQLNVVALALLTRLALPGMKQRRWGRILNLASIVGHQPAGPRMAAYYASKAFVLSFSKALAVELEGSGVSVTTLSPGITASQFEERSGAGDSLIFRWLPKSSPDEVARAGYLAMKQQRREVIPGLIPKILALAGQMPPRWIGVQVNRWLLGATSCRTRG